jgi:hypothetical protein
MADFRKWILALTLVALFTGAASAQTPLTCVANAGVPPLLRAEGLAELVGDVVIACSGGDGLPQRVVNFDIFLNTNITSDILTGNISEALLLVDEPAPGNFNLGQNVYQGVRTAGFENRLTWNGVVFQPPTTPGDTRIFRITNVRSNATQLPTGQFVPSSVSMFLNVSPPGSLPLTQTQLVVGTVLPSMAVASNEVRFRQCVPQPEVALTPQTMNITFTELFATAFKKRIEGEVGAPIAQDAIGTLYSTESGFTPFGTDIGAAGVADTGTRFVIRVSAVPAGVALNAPSGVASSAAVNGQALELRRVTGWDGNFAGGGVSPDARPAGDPLAWGYSSVGATAGGITLLYEVVGAPGVTGSSVIDTFTVPLQIAFGVTAGLGQATLNAWYAPQNPTATMNALAPEPRFLDAAADKVAFFVDPCRTILLFPFVTNQAGFDTGLAISNTSQDPFGTVNQSGACTLNYYGNTTGGAAAPAAQTSQAIAAGQHLVGSISTGGNLGLAATPGFQGYIIAVCNFQYAHGYAFISDLGASELAQGYLALVIPDRVTARLAAPFSLDASRNHGEQLGH